MSAPATALSQRNVKIIVDGSYDAFAVILQETIARRAYEIFENAGRPSGQDHANWLQAESEVLQHGSAVRESGSWSTANATLAGADAADVQVFLQNDRAFLSCRKPAQSFIIFRFPVTVDPQTAAAYMKGDIFVLTAKHSPSGATPPVINPSNPSPPSK